MNSLPLEIEDRLQRLLDLLAGVFFVLLRFDGAGEFFTRIGHWKFLSVL